MMDVKELRIGNSIYNGIGDVITVYPYLLYHYEDIQLENGNCKPIPLTEQWLEKFGFENRGLTYSGNNFWDIQKYSNTNDFYIQDIEVMHLKYVHQLQNLFHSLTGKELKVKELV